MNFSFKEGQHMSKVVTPPTAQPTPPAAKIPHDKIAQRAYEKWVQRGRQHGTDVQNWVEAENELRTESTRQGGNTSAFKR